jgi:hypothetical protein
MGEEEMEEIAFIMGSIMNDEPITFDPSEEGQHFNFHNNVSSTEEIDEHIIYYDWLGDSATISHITNQ